MAYIKAKKEVEMSEMDRKKKFDEFHKGWVSKEAGRLGLLEMSDIEKKYLMGDLILRKMKKEEEAEAGQTAPHEYTEEKLDIFYQKVLDALMDIKGLLTDDKEIEFTQDKGEGEGIPNDNYISKNMSEEIDAETIIRLGKQGVKREEMTQILQEQESKRKNVGLKEAMMMAEDDDNIVQTMKDLVSDSSGFREDERANITVDMMKRIDTAEREKRRRSGNVGLGD